MDVFNLDRALVSDYERFARSFTQIKAAEIRAQVERIYANGKGYFTSLEIALRKLQPHSGRHPGSYS